MFYHNDAQLERSSVVANCSMNRERSLAGSNGYDVELGFQPLDFLRSILAKNQQAKWLDLCCGTGRAVEQAAQIIDVSDLPIEILGVDLVGAFLPSASRRLRLIEASLSTWAPHTTFDLITCVHGLHYVGDKLGAIAKACSWLSRDGLLVAHLDTANLRLLETGLPSRTFVTALRKAGVEYWPRKHLIRCQGFRQLEIPFQYLGSNDEAGPNYTKQPAVHSFYTSDHTPSSQTTR